MSSSVKTEYTELAQEDKQQTSSEQASKCAREDVCREDKKKFKLSWPFIFLISAALLISVALLTINFAVSCILVLKINTQTLEIATLKENYTTLEKLVANEQKIQLDKITEQIEEMNETWTERAAFETAKTRNEIKEVQQGMRALNKSLEKQQTTMADITSEVTQLAKQVESSDNVDIGIFVVLFLQFEITSENITSLSQQIKEMKETLTERVATETAIARNETLLQKMVVDLKELVTTTMLTQNNVTHEIKELQQSMRVLNKSLEEQQAEITQLAKKVKSSNAALFLQLGVTRENITSMSKLSERSSHSLQQFQEQLSSNASKLGEIVMAVNRIKANTSKADKQIQDNMRSLFAIQTSQKSIGDSLDRLQGEVYFLDFSTVANQSLLKSKVNSQGQKMRFLETSVVAKQTSQRSKDNSQDEEINELSYEVHRLMSSAYQHNSSTLTTIVCCVVYIIVTAY